MISRNLRHLRLFLAACEPGSLTRASEVARVLQPAVTQALGKLEREVGGPLFDRTRHGVVPTERGEVPARRAAGALARLDPSLREVSPRLPLTASAAQLSALIALIAVVDAEIAKGLLIALDVRADWPARPVGLSMREGWLPTQAQGLLLDLLRAAAARCGRR